MNPYKKSTTDQEELFNIIRSLEVLGRNYRIITTVNYVNESWVRAWDIEEYEVSL